MNKALGLVFVTATILQSRRASCISLLVESVNVTLRPFLKSARFSIRA